MSTTAAPVSPTNRTSPSPTIATIKIAVGNCVFHTTRATLRRGGGMLAAMFGDMLGRGMTNTNERGHYFIDRDPAPFADILSYLRTSNIAVFNRGLWPVTRMELEYYTEINPRSIDLHMIGVDYGTLEQMLAVNVQWWQTEGPTMAAVHHKAGNPQYVANQMCVLVREDRISFRFEFYDSIDNILLCSHLVRQMERAAFAGTWQYNALCGYVAKLFGARRAQITPWSSGSRWNVNFELEFSRDVLPEIDSDDERVVAVGEMMKNGLG